MSCLPFKDGRTDFQETQSRQAFPCCCRIRFETILFLYRFQDSRISFLIILHDELKNLILWSGGRLSSYLDRYGLEADGVLHLDNGRYALIEHKLGSSSIDAEARNLSEIERLDKIHKGKETQCLFRLPELKVTIPGTRYGYRRSVGVLVIPIGCLKN